MVSAKTRLSDEAFMYQTSIVDLFLLLAVSDVDMEADLAWNRKSSLIVYGLFFRNIHVQCTRIFGTLWRMHAQTVCARPSFRAWGRGCHNYMWHCGLCTRTIYRPVCTICYAVHSQGEKGLVLSVWVVCWLLARATSRNLGNWASCKCSQIIEKWNFASVSFKSLSMAINQRRVNSLQINFWCRTLYRLRQWFWARIF